MNPSRCSVLRQAWPVAVWVAIALTPHAYAAEQAADIKAAFVYNFAKFVEWPATAFTDPSSPLLLCTAGPRALDGRLDQLSGREAQGHRIEVIDAATGNGTPDVSRCHLLFVPATDAAEQRKWLEAAAGKPVLTVSDVAAFDEQGGMIALFVERDRLKFAVNLGTLQAAELKMSARILNLATRVRQERRP
ncbi:MAG: YfiR family protein [Pseudomonadota bacterium]